MRPCVLACDSCPLGIGALRQRPGVPGVDQIAVPALTGAAGTVVEVAAKGSDVRRVRVVKPAGFSFQAGKHVKAAG